MNASDGYNPFYVYAKIKRYNILLGHFLWEIPKITPSSPSYFCQHIIIYLFHFSKLSDFFLMVTGIIHDSKLKHGMIALVLILIKFPKCCKLLYKFIPESMVTISSKDKQADKAYAIS
jgi:hypothetical protein